jgi:uncharacterized protein YbbK (DUF523 family)
LNTNKYLSGNLNLIEIYASIKILGGEKTMIIVSGCLAGLHCRYNGEAKPDKEVIRLVAEGKAVPVCPEQLGGLSTPRQPSEITKGRVFRKDGVDVTEEFQNGAREALKLAKMVNAKQAILKSRSPSCGSGKIYDGTFSGLLVDGNGVFAALCKANGIDVKTEEDCPI